MFGLIAKLIGKDAPLVPLHTVDVMVPLDVYTVGLEKMGSPVVDPGSAEIVMFAGQMIVIGSGMTFTCIIIPNSASVLTGVD